MSLQTFSPNFLIKVPKQEEIDKRDKEGDIYLHPAFVWMTRNTQSGIIEHISNEAKKQLPQASVGDILICHHFTQASHSTRETAKKFLVHEDNTYNYYNVNSMAVPGQNNKTYGVFTNGIVIPHKDYVFLEKPVEDKEGWYQSTEDVLAKVARIKNDIQYISKGKISSETIEVIQKKEAEMSRLSAGLQRKEYLPYKVAYSNPSLNVANGSIAYFLSIATKTEISFLDKTYIVAESKFLGATD